jgi:hypothetical protein
MICSSSRPIARHTRPERLVMAYRSQVAAGNDAPASGRWLGVDAFGLGISKAVSRASAMQVWPSPRRLPTTSRLVSWGLVDGHTSPTPRGLYPADEAETSPVGASRGRDRTVASHAITAGMTSPPASDCVCISAALRHDLGDHRFRACCRPSRGAARGRRCSRSVGTGRSHRMRAWEDAERHTAGPFRSTSREAST